MMQEWWDRDLTELAVEGLTRGSFKVREHKVENTGFVPTVYQTRTEGVLSTDEVLVD